MQLLLLKTAIFLNHVAIKFLLKIPLIILNLPKKLPVLLHLNILMIIDFSNISSFLIKINHDSF